MQQRKVEYYSNGTKIVGYVNLPDDYKKGTKLPCIIPCSGFTGIGAAYPTLLSRLFTKHGYACVTFDYRGWAPSDGEVGHTNAEDEYLDIEATYIFAQQQPEIQSENVALFGWGFSAPIVLKLAANYPEIKAVGCGNGFYNGERCMRSIMNWEDYLSFRKIAREDLVSRVMTGKGALTPPYQQGGATRSYSYRTGNIEPLTLDWLVENAEVAYDKDTHTNTKNFMDVMGVPETIERDYGGRKNFPPYQGFEVTDSMLRTDASADAKKVAPRPVFVVHAVEDAAYPVFEAEAIAKDIGPSCTTLFVEGDHNGFMFDDHPEFARFSKEIVAFYDKALK